jgi:hypothetical protein
MTGQPASRPTTIYAMHTHCEDVRTRAELPRSATHVTRDQRATHAQKTRSNARRRENQKLGALQRVRNLPKPTFRPAPSPNSPFFGASRPFPARAYKD